MDYKKKLKKGLYTGIILLAIGIFCGISSSLKLVKNDAMFVYAIMFCGVGILRIARYIRITRNEEVLRDNEIIENDERNLSIWGYAKCIAFEIYIYLCIVAIIVFEWIGWVDRANVLGYSLCVIVAIYYISYFIMKRIT